MNIFNLSNASANITINIDHDALFINDIAIALPVDWKVLKKCFGEPTEIKRNGIYWKGLGVSTNPHGNSLTDHLTLHTDYNPMEVRSKSEQKPFFRGKILINEIEINKKKFDEITGRKYEVTYFAYTKNKPCLISIAYNQIFDASYVKPELTKDKYVLKELNEETIEFSDFGFKLSVIQELMYNKELLKPKFDLYEFVEWYDKRKIDIEEEGYAPIPEITQYFKDLPIPKKYAPQLTEIYQDGGNDIYLQLLRFGEGWEDYWNIANSDDAKQFPNLKKAILCYAEDYVIEALNALGIKAEWL